MEKSYNFFGCCLRILFCFFFALSGILPSATFAGLNEYESNKASQINQNTIRIPENSYPINGLYSPVQPVIVLAMSSSNTSSIVGRINSGRNQCSSVAAEYQADCLAQTFRSASRATNGKPDYAGAGRELRNADKRISAIVSANIDKSAPVIRKGGKKLRAVKKSAVAKVNKKTKAIIAETETKLIRSAGNSAKRKTHFAQIAKAVGSTKNILRST